MLSITWSVDPNRSIFVWIKYFIYFTIGFILFILLSINFTKTIAIIAKSTFVSSIIISFAYLLKFAKYGILILTSGKATMANIASIASINVGFGGGRNLLASWITFSLTFAFPILYTQVSKKIKIVLLFGVLVNFIVIILTLSRTSQLALLIFALLLIFYNEKNILKNLSIKMLSSLFGLLIIIIFNPINLRNFLFNRFILAIKSLAGEIEDYGVLGRIELWTYAIKSIEEKFFTGTGIGTLYGGLNEIGGVQNYHNVFLQFFAQIGFIGFILFVIWTLWLFIMAYKLHKFYFFNFRLKLIAYIILLNFIVYYFKSLLMFQYFDLEIWTIIPTIFALYYLKEKVQNEKYMCSNSSF
ncbi:O-antigen ligase family protein [Thermodesulfobacterium hydrogeniphilum]|uniref:O-antigen ligase family protein n=1 Tax=Thermodesulfobacterium hydrogeniphilum TaxID=161156 RepID=UPI00146F9501|nr:O-antigen ligase family protein [Thermodesulfobacterium hydrogeniphilum]